MENRNLRKERIGVVTSNKMEKSIVVSEVKRVNEAPYVREIRFEDQEICCPRREERLQRR